MYLATSLYRYGRQWWYQRTTGNGLKSLSVQLWLIGLAIVNDPLILFNIRIGLCKAMNRKIAVGTAPRLRDGRNKECGSIRAYVGAFSLLRNVQTGSGAHQGCRSMGTGCDFPEDKTYLHIGTSLRNCGTVTPLRHTPYSRNTEYC